MAPSPDADPRAAASAQIVLAGLADLMACASHDLIGPLNRAASLLDLLIRRHSGELGAEGDRILEFLLTSSTRMKDVTTGMNRYIEVAGTAPESTIVNLNESLDGARARLTRSIAERGAIIEADPLPRVSADAGQMVTLFELLIANSIKFSRPDSALRVRISSLRRGNAEDVAVTDNGIGIDPAYSDAVFHPFRRLNGAEYAGVGLGLTIAKLIAELHGGSIRIEQPHERGVSVHFTLPAA